MFGIYIKKRTKKEFRVYKDENGVIKIEHIFGTEQFLGRCNVFTADDFIDKTASHRLFGVHPVVETVSEKFLLH